MDNNDEEEIARETSDSRAMVDIKVSDVLGLSKTAVEVRKASENILKSMEKGIGKFSKPVITILQAKADAKALAIRSEAEFEIIEKTIDLYLNFVQSLKNEGVSEELAGLVQRSSERQLLEGLEKQGVREKIGYLLFDQMSLIPQKRISSEQIDDDWLSLFWTTVESKSTEDLQKIYARILAGECLCPGSFSARLLHILSIMTQKDARSFEVVCSMSIQDIGGAYVLEPLQEFDNFLQDAITGLDGMGDYVIEDLESLGLLGRSSMVAFHEEEDGTEKNIGGITCTVRVKDKELLSSNQNYITGIPFTKPAEELRSIISLQPNQKYYVALSTFIKEHLGIELLPSEDKGVT